MRLTKTVCWNDQDAVRTPTCCGKIFLSLRPGKLRGGGGGDFERKGASWGRGMLDGIKREGGLPAEGFAGRKRYAGRNLS